MRRRSSGADQRHGRGGDPRGRHGPELGSFGLNDAPAFIRQPILAGSSGQLYLDIDDLDGHLEVVDTSTWNVVARIRIDASEIDSCAAFRPPRC